ncbi:MAG: pectate lyase, partial [Paludibacteraceae bacterium]|nr:pectate lyase [Paludibacteraceae bacterium]
GETVLTTISKNNISLIGQSMDGVIIKNAPDAKTESIDKTATLRIAKNVSGTYLQDLTIQNALDYYKSDNGRAVALWDQGTQTVCKNVRLLSHQDTYYSNLPGAVRYMEDCEIHGAVDFICGDGSVYFKNNLLYAEMRKKDGGGSDALTANNGQASDKGYVFEGCTLMSECPVVSLGRAWNNSPKVAFLNTLVDYSEGEFSFTDGSKIERWTKELMNPNAWPQFGEYNTHLADGTVLTPASNVVTFIDTKSANATQDIQTVLTADEAATYTMEYTLGEWAATAKADATQAVCEKEAKDFEADGLYLVEAEGEFKAIIKGGEFMDRFALYDGVNYTVRKANARGGFGEAAGDDETTGVEAVSNQPSAVSVQKVLRGGQLIIIRGGMQYNTIGQTIR